MGVYKNDGVRLFSVVPSERTRSDAYKLKHKKFQINTQKNCFTVRVVKDRNRLAGGVVESPSLEIFKSQLDNALSNLLSLTLL